MRSSAAIAVCALLVTSAAAHGDHGAHAHADEATSSSTSAAATETVTVPKPKFTSTSVKAPFLEQFTEDWQTRWTPSEATKKTASGGETWSYVGKWSVEESSVYPAIDGDLGLVAKSKATHHAISAPFTKAIALGEKPLVVQYEVKYQQGGNCGGGYIKLLEDGFQNAGREFDDKTPWTIMFGPDLTCPGTKVHFIFRHKNPKTGEYEEKHLNLPPNPSIEKSTKLYTLIVKPDNTFQVLIDGDSVKSGNLLEDFTPAVNPAKEIDDPKDTKPEDWVEEAKIADPEATKPAEWDEDAPYEIPDADAVKPETWLDAEPSTIPDPDAVKPEEWDDEEDGDWVAASVPNPKCQEAAGCGEWKRPQKVNPDYKGKWYAPQIDNPAYKGTWAPAKIANPDYFEDLHPVKSLNKIGGVGIELWTMTEDILFDNIYIGHSEEDAKALAKESFEIKKDGEAAAAKADSPVTPPEDLDDEDIPTFASNPAGFVRAKVAAFVDLVKADPVNAFKSQPETGAALVIGLLTLISMLGAVAGIVGGSAPAKKTVANAKKAVDTAKETVKEKAAPVAAAGGEKKEEAAKKRK
ncbi:Calreticulin-domain-containing protein [Auriculariales sp. MPI-PUGE-AT-0066]|nr:Calreticulin-domain-containing protein [Auriculariales sp. MPI-PUGE-AT-0066]